MKTINFLTSHFLPENTACTNRVLSMVLELEKYYRINVICLTQKGLVPRKNKVSYSKNVKIYYTYQEDYDGSRFFKRAINEILYINKLIKVSNSLKHSLVIVTSPYMFMIPLVGFFISGVKILDIRDLVWEYLNGNGIFNKSIKKVLSKLMYLGMKRFNHINVTNVYEFHLLTSKYKLTGVDIIPNGIDLLSYNQLTQIKIKTKENFTVSYIGNIGIAQNIKVLIDAAVRLPDVNFLIIGDGIETDSLIKYTKRLDINNVSFRGKQSWVSLKKYYEKSSILYAQLDENFVSAMPSKLYEYASVGLPIIYGGVGQAKLFVKNLENSIVISPNNVELLVNTIKEFKDKKILISEYNRRLIKNNYLREKASKKLLNIVKEKIN